MRVRARARARVRARALQWFSRVRMTGYGVFTKLLAATAFTQSRKVI